jgi:hypothetical protein
MISKHAAPASRHRIRRAVALLLAVLALAVAGFALRGIF